MLPMLLDGPAGKNADLAQVNGVVDLGPGEFFVTVLFSDAVNDWLS